MTKHPIVRNLSETNMTDISVTPLNSAGGSRSFGNRMVMVLLCAFLLLALVIQLIMYFVVVRHRDENQVDNLHHKKILAALSSMGDFHIGFVMGMYHGESDMNVNKGFQFDSPSSEDICLDGVRIKPLDAQLQISPHV